MIPKFNMKIISSVILVSILLFPSISTATQFVVTRVYDGDTLTVESEGYKLKVRLVGIDAPETSRKKNEPGQPYSQKAKIHLQKLVLNKTIEIESYGLDRYSRILAVAYVDGINVNLEMVKEGLAEVYKGKPAPGFDNRPYWEAEQKARNAGLYSILPNLGGELYEKNDVHSNHMSFIDSCVRNN